MAKPISITAITKSAEYGSDCNPNPCPDCYGNNVTATDRRLNEHPTEHHTLTQWCKCQDCGNMWLEAFLVIVKPNTEAGAHDGC